MWNDQCTKSIDQVAVLLARLPFGSSPAPSKFCITFKMAFDLTGDLLCCKQWDSIIPLSPYASQILDPVRLPENIEFGEATKADVRLDPAILGGTDGYNNDRERTVLDNIWN